MQMKGWCNIASLNHPIFWPMGITVSHRIIELFVLEEFLRGLQFNLLHKARLAQCRTAFSWLCPVLTNLLQCAIILHRKKNLNLITVFSSPTVYLSEKPGSFFDSLWIWVRGRGVWLFFKYASEEWCQCGIKTKR